MLKTSIWKAGPQWHVSVHVPRQRLAIIPSPPPSAPLLLAAYLLATRNWIRNRRHLWIECPVWRIVSTSRLVQPAVVLIASTVPPSTSAINGMCIWCTQFRAFAKKGGEGGEFVAVLLRKSGRSERGIFVKEGVVMGNWVFVRVATGGDASAWAWGWVLKPGPGRWRGLWRSLPPTPQPTDLFKINKL